MIEAITGITFFLYTQFLNWATVSIDNSNVPMIKRRYSGKTNCNI